MTDNNTPAAPSSSDLRKFGFIMAVFLILLFGLLIPWLFDAEEWPRIPFYLAAAFALPAIVYPPILHYPYKAWMAFGRVMGWINSRLILGILFFLIFLPFGIVMRTFGWDPMFRKLDPNAKTYRVLTKPRDRDHFERPY